MKALLDLDPFIVWAFSFFTLLLVVWYLPTNEEERACVEKALLAKNDTAIMVIPTSKITINMH